MDLTKHLFVLTTTNLSLSTSASFVAPIQERSGLRFLIRHNPTNSRIVQAKKSPISFMVILPLTKEGLVIGGTLVFTGALTAYITPAILGGSKVLMLETLLYQKVNVSNDFVSASVIAMILIVMSFSANLLLKRIATARV